MTSNRYKYPALIFLLWLIWVALPIGNRGLWAPDEPRYLQVAWEMVSNQSFLIPVMNAELYSHKPPLFFWLTMLMANIVPFEEASRWVSALMSLGTLWLTFLIGKRVKNEGVGFTASLLLMTCGLYIWLMGNGNIDTTLTFFTTLSFWMYLSWERTGKTGWIFGAYAACGAGILAKGPVGLLLPWLTFTVWAGMAFYRGERPRLLHLAWGPVLSLAIVGIWLVPACISGGEEYTRLILFKQNFGRAVSSFSHVRPWYYFFTQFPGLSMPWFILMLAAVPDFREGFKGKDRTFLFFMVWFVTVFVFFSLLSGKRGRYLLPAFPAFCLTISCVLHRWEERRSGTTRSLRIIGGIIGVFSLCLMGFPAVGSRLGNAVPSLELFEAPLSYWRLAGLYGSGVCLLAVLWGIFKTRKISGQVAAGRGLAVGVLLLLGMVQIYYVPGIDPVKSVLKASKAVQSALPDGGTVAFLNRRYDNGWNFYLNRKKIPVTTLERMDQSGVRYDLLIARKKRAPLDDLLNRFDYEIYHVQRIGSKEFLLLKSRHYDNGRAHG